MPDPIEFTSTSARYRLPYLFAGQAQKELTVNEAQARLDTLIHPAIEGEADVPPAGPTDGETWLVGQAPQGAWDGRAGQLACRQAGAWLFVEPRDGLRLLDRGSGGEMRYRGGWMRVPAITAPLGGGTVDSEARTAISELISALVVAGILPAS